MVLTATKLTWETVRVGFHRTQITSTPVTFTVDNEVKQVQFAVSEFTSDEEDFFGVNVPKYGLAFKELAKGENDPEFYPSSEWYLGEFSKPEFAKMFANFTLENMKNGLGLALAPVAELDPDPYFLP